MTDSRGFFGHPRGLSTLFFTEMWERFSFYGMKAMLFLFVTATIAEGGLEMGAEQGGAVVGIYNSMVYLLALPGGWLADRIFGCRKAVLYGGIIIACGHYAMAVPTLGTFYLGLLLIVIGTGLLKPNISTMVGELYPGDAGARRDAGFSIFYMGINIGATLAPLACSWMRTYFGTQVSDEVFRSAWHLGFGLAGLGMTFGVIWYIIDGKHLGDAGGPPERSPEERAKTNGTCLRSGIGLFAIIGLFLLLDVTGILAVTWTLVAYVMGTATLVVVAIFLAYVAFFTGLDWAATKKVIVIGILFVFTAMFWSGFEQASTSLTNFAEEVTDRNLLGWMMPTEFMQSINPFFIIVLAPVFGSLWIRLAAKNLNPSIPVKFALGLIQLSLGFVVVMYGASAAAEAEDGRAGLHWLCLTYLLFTTGELCLSPVGLSSITKLAPDRFKSQMMGIWFIAAALGNLIAGLVGGLIEDLSHVEIFRTVAIIVGVSGGLFLIAAPFIQKKMMGDVR